MEDFDVIEEFVACERKKATIWIVFHTIYNNLHAFGFEATDNLVADYLNPEMTDNRARNEFLDFMKNIFPDIKLIKVRDLVSPRFLDFPYLGSIAIDCDIESDCAKALYQKYGSPFEEPDNNSSVLWVLEHNEALAKWREREKIRDIEE